MKKNSPILVQCVYDSTGSTAGEILLEGFMSFAEKYLEKNGYGH